jgi:hypothetical protein
MRFQLCLRLATTEPIKALCHNHHRAVAMLEVTHVPRALWDSWARK